MRQSLLSLQSLFKPRHCRLKCRDKSVFERRFDQHDVTEANLSFALRPRVHAVAESPRSPAGRRDRPDLVLLVLEQPRENLEVASAKVLGDVLHHDRIAQVWLVGAIFLHRLGVRDARPGRGRDGLATRERFEDAPDDRLHRSKNIALLHEAHFDVELVEFARQAVGAGILVAKAGRDLEIAVEARHHQKLLVLLGRLRQRVEFARMQTRRHQKVARALRARGGEDRRLELEKSLPLHSSAKRINDLTAQHDVLVQFLAPEIEEATGRSSISAGHRWARAACSSGLRSPVRRPRQRIHDDRRHHRARSPA